MDIKVQKSSRAQSGLFQFPKKKKKFPKKACPKFQREKKLLYRARGWTGCQITFDTIVLMGVMFHGELPDNTGPPNSFFQFP